MWQTCSKFRLWSVSFKLCHPFVDAYLELSAFLLGFHDTSNSFALRADILRIRESCFKSSNGPLHLIRVQDAVQPPTLLAFALPHLPPPLPSLIVNGLKYLQMGSLFLDDLSGLVVGLGFIVWFSGWFAT